MDIQKKIIVYAMGQVFKKQKDKIKWENVVAIADKNPAGEKEIKGVPVITPEQIYDIEYDAIAIFSNHLFEEIKRELVGEFHVPVEKIMSWKNIVQLYPETDYNIAKLYVEYLRQNEFDSILDVGMNILPKEVLTPGKVSFARQILIDGLRSEEAKENRSLYHHVYERYEEIKNIYSVVILSNRQMCDGLENLKEKTNCFLSHFVNMEDGNQYFDSHFNNETWRLRQMPSVEGVLWSAERRKNIKKDIAVYVVTHRAYGVKNDELYKPICVGGYKKEYYLSEEMGKNIAYLNPKINECTALYWIWKNTSHDYVGLNHYRRYFYNSSMKNTGNYLDKETIQEILKDYDIILPEVRPMDVGVKEIDRLKTTMDENAFRQGYALVRNAIEKYQPDYLQAFDDVMNGHSIFVCNMFVAKKHVMDEYCKWLFSFLIEVAESIDVTIYDDYSKRVIGFFAERMWTVWLRKQPLKIKEMPYDEL